LAALDLALGRENNQAFARKEYRLAMETPVFSQADTWSCGFRNIQMLCGALLLSDAAYGKMLFGRDNIIPSVRNIQQWIERAWARGFDVEGSEQVGPLVDTKKWIGATDAYALLCSFRIRVFVTDFQKYETQKLGDWVWNYFCPPKDSTWRPPPIYLQHQGHSRTIVGCERRLKGKEEETLLLIWDPQGKPEYAMREALGGNSGWQGLIKRKVANMKPDIQYQILWVDQCEHVPVIALSSEESESCKKITAEPNHKVPNHVTLYESAKRIRHSKKRSHHSVECSGQSSNHKKSALVQDQVVMQEVRNNFDDALMEDMRREEESRQKKRRIDEERMAVEEKRAISQSIATSVIEKKRHRLSDEPAHGSPFVHFQVKGPTEFTVSRRFSPCDRVQAVFDFIDLECGPSFAYSLELTHPRTVLNNLVGKTFTEIGLRKGRFNLIFVKGDSSDSESEDL